MLIIGGATATGKSGIAVQVAKELNGEIISADSMQIYKYMDIGTAKVTTKEKQGIIHHLIDIVEPEDNFSVAEFSALAREKISDIKARNKVPIIVGGTGLYINSLIYEYKLPNQDLELRNRLKNELESVGKEEMYKKLCLIDPVSASKIHPNNVKRVLRALEVYLSSGQSIGEKDDKREFVPHKMYAINIDREMLYQKINARVEKMFQLGLLNELEFLLNERKLNFEMQSMQAIGYKEFREYFDANNVEIKLEDVQDNIKQHTRNYAKRQITWLKNIPTCQWLNNKEKQQIIDRICTDYSKYKSNL